MYEINQTETRKSLRSPSYNYDFYTRTGLFARWGTSKEDDPQYSEFGPEIVDIEISSGAGCPMSCPYCYKGNGKGDSASNMSLATFERVLSVFPDTVTQIAFGITSVASSPDLFDIFRHCHRKRVVPNVTVNGSDPVEEAWRLARMSGAIAVSINEGNYEQGVQLVERLSGLNGQVNVHCLVSEQTVDFVYELCDTVKHDGRLSGMNAVVFLGLKPKSRGQGFDVLPLDSFVGLVHHCLESGILFGFDSCSASRFEEAVRSSALTDVRKRVLLTHSERCESGLFSLYVDVKGRAWFCSFGEGETECIADLTEVEDFMSEVWFNDAAVKWRHRLMELDRECPLYEEIRR